MSTTVYDVSNIRKKILFLCREKDTKPEKLFEIFDAKQDQVMDIFEFDLMLTNLGIILPEDEVKEAF